ncbi:acyl-CoA thioesterase [Mammaliicoccus stepanovicii]|uniref:Acyl-CoA hydrolase n=1 Tax=Mammaliicoccus stepanovicii TaxID=643214 RepID=A0A239YUR4_9STAP|nr:acyl-CoA thioesterase [Mammaliicoccus stepanovicii]PNZ73515.1 acyl-CoA thioesterase [Mammaliicoccus stepanovicii]GGI42250.1 acyl-CoA thioesterase [Mammaliicoccus stepanovicii]SNV62303.1 acyl-CoA hydrolase [Mammaliicoccus stepanovicii]
MSEKKPMKESRSVKSIQIFPEDTNHHNTMFGGKLMAEIDEIAAIAAMRHSGSSVVTASTDSVDFLKPIRTGEIVSLVSFVTHAGKSSMEICVKVISEDIINNQKHLSAYSFLTFVALDKEGNKALVPSIYPETEDEKWFYETAKERVQLRHDRRDESKKTLDFMSTKLYI